MHIIIYRSASREEIQPTLLSFADGVVLERDFLDWSALKEQGLIYSRYCFDTDTDNEQGVCIRDRMCILAADELQDVIAITVNGKLLLIRNDTTGELEYVPLVITGGKRKQGSTNKKGTPPTLEDVNIGDDDITDTADDDF
ncbi:hypothetical protein ACO29I_03610 [Eggerthellaceae bacterium DNF00809]